MQRVGPDLDLASTCVGLLTQYGYSLKNRGFLHQMGQMSPLKGVRTRVREKSLGTTITKAVSSRELWPEIDSPRVV